MQIYLDDREYQNLCEWSDACRMSMSVYLRQLINGFRPIEFPPLEYEKIMEDLQKVGVNLNQLAVKAHSLGFIDEPEYRKNAQVVWKLCADMTEQLTERGVRFGSHENMGCQESPD